MANDTNGFTSSYTSHYHSRRTGESREEVSGKIQYQSKQGNK